MVYLYQRFICDWTVRDSSNKMPLGGYSLILSCSHGELTFPDPCILHFQQLLGPDKLVVDLKDPNRPRFTMEELKEVLQERNQLKTQLLLTQEELQLYKRYDLSRNLLWKKAVGHIFLFQTFILVWINALYIDMQGPYFSSSSVRHTVWWSVHSGVLHQAELSMADIDLEPKEAEASNAKIERKEGPKEEKTTIRKL